MKRLPRLTWQEGMVLNHLFADYAKIPKEPRELIKPALILVGDESDGVHASRFRIFREIHPANVVGSPHYAMGTHVRKTVKGLVKCLRRILSRKIETVVKEEDGGTNHYCRSCGSLVCRSDVVWMERRENE